MKKIRLSCLALILIFVSVVGCVSPKPIPDPLANWHHVDVAILYLNAAIMQDYQDYIQKLPPDEKGVVVPADFLKDEKGQHAVEFGVGVNGRWWRHILFYNQANERTKVIVYKTGKYQS